MAILATEWKLGNTVAQDYTVDRTIVAGENLESTRIDSLGSLNAFIGPNNSGKSRLLRSLFDDTSHFWPGYEKFIDIYDARARLREFCVQRNYKENWAINHIAEDLPVFRANTGRQGPATNFDQKQNDWRRHSNRDQIRQYLSNVRQEDRSELSRLFDQYSRAVSQLDVQSIVKYPRLFYIPTLRSLKELAPNDALGQRINIDYFKSQETESHYGNDRRQDLDALRGKKIITGQDFYGLVRSHLLGSLADRDRIRKYENFLSETFYANQTVSLIPREEVNVTNNLLHIKIGDAKEQPVKGLGDGIAQILILTMPMFLLGDEPTIFVIEEPEMHLHQGLQRLFVDVTLNGPFNENRQVFITTHSSQFLDLTLDTEDISVYRLKSDLPPLQENDIDVNPKFTVSLVSGDRRPLLAELGIHNSSVMLANCTVWVEGITDRLYIRRYLELYQQSLSDKHLFLEDIHYAFVEYGGANLSHWSIANDDDESINVDYLCSQGILIADRDSQEWKSERAQSLKEKLGDKFISLPAREIENLLSKDIIAKVLTEYEGDPLLKS